MPLRVAALLQAGSASAATATSAQPVCQTGNEGRASDVAAALSGSGMTAALMLVLAAAFLWRQWRQLQWHAVARRPSGQTAPWPAAGVQEQHGRGQAEQPVAQPLQQEADEQPGPRGPQDKGQQQEGGGLVSLTATTVSLELKTPSTVSPFAAAAAGLQPFASPTRPEQQQTQQAPQHAPRLDGRRSPPHLSTAQLPLARLPGSGDSSSSIGSVASAVGITAPDRASLSELRAELLSESGALPLSQLGATVPGGFSWEQQPSQQQHQVEQSTEPSSSSHPHLWWKLAPTEVEICRRPDGSLWQLGAGGFGRVYKAMRFGVQPVAVKVLAPAAEARHGVLEDFQREVQLLKACIDPSIVRFLGASLSRDFTMLVTEYCEGGTLSANLAAGRISWYRRGKQVALDVARGLAFMHGRRLVHFDLKSANILLDKHGNAKISDMGMAKLLAHELSAVTGNLGTLSWAAPEMLLGQRCTEKADIYSFGVVLWELCTACVPVRGRMRKLRVPADCPAQVAALVDDCMEPDPTLRPSAQQLVERLLLAPAAPSPEQGAGEAPQAQPRRQRQDGTAARPPLPRRMSIPVAAASSDARPETQATQERGPPALQQHRGSLPLPKQPAGTASSPAIQASCIRRHSSTPPEYQSDVYGLGI